MYDPPPGFDDLLGDCDNPPPGFHRLDVDDVGPVLARKPMVNALGNLAMSNNPKLAAERRTEYASLFVQNHLADGEYARLLAGMITDELPADAIRKVGQALATWGTARPTVPSSR